MKTRFFESRIVRTHPQTVTMRPSGLEVRMSLISSVFIIGDFSTLEKKGEGKKKPLAERLRFPCYFIEKNTDF